MSRQVALIRESAGGGDFCKRSPAAHHGSRCVEAAEDQIAVWTDAQQRPESARELPTILPADAFEIIKSDIAVRVGVYERARQRHRLEIHAPVIRLFTPKLRQRLREVEQGLIILQSTKVLVEITNEGRGGRVQPRVVRYTLGKERKGATAESLLKRGRSDTRAPVPKVSPVPGVTVVKLIRMENDDLTGHRMTL